MYEEICALLVVHIGMKSRSDINLSGGAAFEK